MSKWIKCQSKNYDDLIKHDWFVVIDQLPNPYEHSYKLMGCKNCGKVEFKWFGVRGETLPIPVSPPKGEPNNE